ncbi:bifunctional adenosylcobinamide kinase/adenosylcobinamide-phosphate guanylyltransferase [Clostridium sp. YIM B02551]|uniref:bifunctional adenosylcobinamide kinase/adenosylcobinamide-phosphate guanylyltransferase n=1 Tax=Clostridium sp. YIM B02551 TaxID=2910679 RepID=UPI001EEACD3F|nr:bifunctional adenosylcobinamide kinase/adenosylcobinamide-phosphate guanylyltransferase [Clostridium sp. YIM B02551]
MILVTGGARSGKSSFGEALLKDKEKVLYIATSIPLDGEMKKRIQKHRSSRNPNWDTLEAYEDIATKIKDAYDGIILDCITVMITNLLFMNMESFEEEDIIKVDYSKKEEDILKEVSFMIKEFKNIEDNYGTEIIIVTNEVGAGLVPEHKLGREFRDIAGRVNQYIAKEADKVFLVISGIPVKIKGE